MMNRSKVLGPGCARAYCARICIRNLLSTHDRLTRFLLSFRLSLGLTLTGSAPFTYRHACEICPAARDSWV